jgi:hypothetical protein
MSNHLTPTELAFETGLNRQDVIATCVELGVPIFAGKIDKTLFAASLQASGHDPNGSAGTGQTAT